MSLFNVKKKKKTKISVGFKYQLACAPLVGSKEDPSARLANGIKGDESIYIERKISEK